MGRISSSISGTGFCISDFQGLFAECSYFCKQSEDIQPMSVNHKIKSSNTISPKFLLNPYTLMHHGILSTNTTYCNFTEKWLSKYFHFLHQNPYSWTSIFKLMYYKCIYLFILIFFFFFIWVLQPITRIILWHRAISYSKKWKKP